MPGLVARQIIDSHARLGNLRAIVNSYGKNGCSRPVPQIDPVCFLLRVSDKRQILRQVRIKSRRLRWEHCRQGVARGLADRGAH